MKPAIRLLALDIDGTLLNSSFQISKRDRAALRRVRELGTEIILCTGRRHTFALPIASLLGFDLWLCSSNGALTRSSRGETFDLHLLSADVTRRFCQHMSEFRSGMVITFDKETRGALVLEHQNLLAHSVGRWLQTNAPWIAYVTPIEDSLVEDPLQAMVCGSLPSMSIAETHLREWTLGRQVTLVKTEYPHRDLSILDLLAADCSKGHAVKRWAQHRGLTRDQVMAIGDNYNDIEMLHFAGLPVVMANASSDLKQYGWLETLSNDESGIAAALNQVFGPGVLNLDHALS